MKNKFEISPNIFGCMQLKAIDDPNNNISSIKERLHIYKQSENILQNKIEETKVSLSNPDAKSCIRTIEFYSITSKDITTIKTNIFFEPIKIHQIPHEKWDDGKKINNNMLVDIALYKYLDKHNFDGNHLSYEYYYERYCPKLIAIKKPILQFSSEKDIHDSSVLTVSVGFSSVTGTSKNEIMKERLELFDDKFLKHFSNNAKITHAFNIFAKSLYNDILPFANQLQGSEITQQIKDCSLALCIVKSAAAINPFSFSK